MGTAGDFLVNVSILLFGLWRWHWLMTCTGRLQHDCYDVRRTQLAVSSAGYRAFECCATLQEPQHQFFRASDAAVHGVLQPVFPARR